VDLHLASVRDEYPDNAVFVGTVPPDPIPGRGGFLSGVAEALSPPKTLEVGDLIEDKGRANEHGQVFFGEVHAQDSVGPLLNLVDFVFGESFLVFAAKEGCDH